MKLWPTLASMAAFALGLTLLAAGCRDPLEANGTAIFVTADLSALSAGHPNQLRFQGSVGSTVAFGPVSAPQYADGGELSGTQSVRLLLKDTYAGKVTDLHGEALANGVRVGTSQAAPVMIVQGYQTNVTLVFASSPPEEVVGTNPPGGSSPPATDAGTSSPPKDAGSSPPPPPTHDAGTPPPPPGKDAGTPPPPPAPDAGTGVCGPCSPATSDGCFDDTCLCGVHEDCGVGSKCVNHACACDKTTCPDGCCDLAGHCNPGTLNNACGKNGNLCAVCLVTDTCDSHSRQCK